jgi:hypothetical protein
MIRTAAIHRRLGPWLIGLYVLAIVGGFVPLVTSYGAHSGAPWTISQSTSSTGPQQRHHLGDADDAAHHHVLQDLTGTVARLPDRNDIPVVHIAIMPVASRPLNEADAVRLERPPKPDLSI